MEARLKRLGSGTRKSKGLLRRRKNAIDACTMTGVDNIEKYKVAKKTAKRAVSVVKVEHTRIFTNIWVRRKERRTFIGWPGFVRERQGTSTKLSALRMKGSISW